VACDGMCLASRGKGMSSRVVRCGVVAWDGSVRRGPCRALICFVGRSVSGGEGGWRRAGSCRVASCPFARRDRNQLGDREKQCWVVQFPGVSCVSCRGVPYHADQAKPSRAEGCLVLSRRVARRSDLGRSRASRMVSYRGMRFVVRCAGRRRFGLRNAVSC
jgi:hypothetical protein